MAGRGNLLGLTFLCLTDFVISEVNHPRLKAGLVKASLGLTSLSHRALWLRCNEVQDLPLGALPQLQALKAAEAQTRFG